MRAPITALAIAVTLLLAAATPGLAAATPGGSAALTRSLNAGMRPAGRFSGAEVVDLSTGQMLYAEDANVARIPASVEKLYTTTTALARFGPDAVLHTDVLGLGFQQGTVWRGSLYLRGGGDPTFGSAAFDRHAYGTGATVQSLAAQLRARGIRTVTGPVLADATLFDGDEGTVATGNQPSIYVEGALSALALNRDWANSDGTVYYAHPAIEAGDQLVAALRAAHIRVKNGHVGTGVTPADATTLASVSSPRMATLVKLMNTPSDNFFAETLLKDLGARFGAGGTTPDGAAVVRQTIASRFGLRPRLEDGSGLAYYDRTSPAQVISLLTQQRDDAAFRDSLAVLGRTGTLLYEDPGTYAAGRCTGKTGTLSDVSNVVGYCTATNGDTLAYAFLMNGVDPDAAHLLQDRLQLSLAHYDG